MNTNIIQILVLCLVIIVDGEINQDMNIDLRTDEYHGYDNKVQKTKEQNSKSTVTTVAYKRTWDSCLSNGISVDVQKVMISGIFKLDDNSCDQKFFEPTRYNISVFVNGQNMVTTVNVPIQSIIIANGAFIGFNNGFVESGYWAGAKYALMVESTNDDPGKCLTQEGVIHTKVRFTTVNFQKSSGERLICYGSGDNVYSPGLQNKS